MKKILIVVALVIVALALVACGEIKPYYIADMVLAIRDWLEAHDVGFEAMLELKHEYNKTRPYRHGGKRI